jgi:hypothetical protein
MDTALTDLAAVGTPVTFSQLLLHYALPPPPKCLKKSRGSTSRRNQELDGLSHPFETILKFEAPIGTTGIPPVGTPKKGAQVRDACLKFHALLGSLPRFRDNVLIDFEEFLSMLETCYVPHKALYEDGHFATDWAHGPCPQAIVDDALARSNEGARGVRNSLWNTPGEHWRYYSKRGHPIEVTSESGYYSPMRSMVFDRCALAVDTLARGGSSQPEFCSGGYHFQVAIAEDPGPGRRPPDLYAFVAGFNRPRGHLGVEVVIEFKIDSVLNEFFGQLDTNTLPGDLGMLQGTPRDVLLQVSRRVLAVKSPDDGRSSLQGNSTIITLPGAF